MTSAEAMPSPPRISATPVHLTWKSGVPGRYQKPHAPSCGNMSSNPLGSAKCAAPAATYVRPSTGHRPRDHAMYPGNACAMNGPTAPHSAVTAARPPHTAATDAACFAGGMALTTAPRYPGSDHGGLERADALVFSVFDVSSDAATRTGRRRHEGVAFAAEIERRGPRDARRGRRDDRAADGAESGHGRRRGRGPNAGDARGEMSVAPGRCGVEVG